ncbi:MAG: hypothetical protein KKH08_03910 [Candidatus Omnitrophica bacterium]|nr:hypothetical protein [Candidatus Omnitrophota bacterium]
MRYIEFRQIMKDFTVFSLKDIKGTEPDFYRSRLNDWQDKGYITKIIKGYYIFSDIDLNEKILFEIANRIYSPSYVSLQTALAHYGLIPESAYGVSSVSTLKTYRFETGKAVFTYRSLSPRLFFGYKIESNEKGCFKIAFPEKAILDYFYLNPEINDIDAYESLRIDKDLFFELVSGKKMDAFLVKFSRSRMAKRIHSFRRFMKNA